MSGYRSFVGSEFSYIESECWWTAIGLRKSSKYHHLSMRLYARA